VQTAKVNGCADGLPYDFILIEDEIELKEQIKFILGIDEDTFMNTSSDEIHRMQYNSNNH